jgi:hypothetical protein
MNGDKQLHPILQIIIVILLFFCLLGMNTCYKEIVGEKNMYESDDQPPPP